MRYDEKEIKATASVLDVVSGFIHLKKSGANYTARCPFHDEKSGSFTVSPSKNIYTCFGCGKTGDAIQFLIDYKKITYPEALEYLAQRMNILPISAFKPEKNKSYTKPKPPVKQQAAFSPKVIQWFAGRKISEQTLLDFKVTEGVEFIPQVKAKRNTIQFNYYKQGELVNTKYRDGQKNFKLVSGAELLFYNLDAVKNCEEIIIVEGEMDALSLHEAGYKNVISVPNGAAVKSSSANLVYLDNSIEYLPENAKYILALDNDLPGLALTDELARRLGHENCYTVVFKDCKDANECLVKYGAQAIRESINEKKEFPIVGVYRASDIEKQIDEYYLNGLPKGHGIDIPEFDEHLKFHLGYLTVITGIPGHGKSEFLDFVAARLNILHGWKFALYSPENHPMQLHFSKFAEKFIGKPWDGYGRINHLELNQAKRHFEDNFFFISPEDDFTLDNILQTVKQLVRKKGVKCFVIDAWNKLEHKYSENETRYISEQLDKITIFCQRNGVHCFLVAHPTKTSKRPDNTFEVPNLYSISGSANFFNKTANGICVYRDMSVHIHFQKVKFKHWGKQGVVVLGWEPKTGRYYRGNPDFENWISKAEVQTAAELKQQAKPLVTNNSFLDQSCIVTDDGSGWPF